MDMPEKIWAIRDDIDDPVQGAWDLFCGDAQYIHIDAVHRLVKRALEEAAVELEHHHSEEADSILCRIWQERIRSLSPEEIMKKEGL